MGSLKKILSELEIFKGLDDKHLKFIQGCASNAKFEKDQFCFKEGDRADRFYIIRHGKISVEIYSPEKGLTIQTLHGHDVLGWSWLFPPYTRHYDAKALELTRVLALDANCLRAKLDKDPEFGYAMMQRFARIMVSRIEAVRLQLIDLYSSQ